MQPLTIDEVKSLKEGDWLWIIKSGKNEYPTLQQETAKYYVAQSSYRSSDGAVGRIFATNTGLTLFLYEEYGDTWVAYRNKEQADDNLWLVAQAQIEILQELLDSDWKCSAMGKLHISAVRKKINKLIKEIKNGK